MSFVLSLYKYLLSHIYDSLNRWDLDLGLCLFCFDMQVLEHVVLVMFVLCVDVY